MVYQNISYEINFILFLIVNAIELCIGTAIFVVFSFSEYNNDGSLDIKIKWKRGHTIAYIILIIGLYQLFLCGGCTRLVTMSNVCTKCEVIESVEFDGNSYTVNNDILVNYKKAWYSNEIEESVVVERRKKICWVAGINKYTKYYEILFNEEDYNKLFSQDIRIADDNNYSLANFVYSKYSIEVYDLDESEDSNNLEHKDREETREASIKVEKQEELGENWNREVLEELQKELSSISNNINDINKNIQEQKKELESQKKEIEELKENKPMDTGKVGVIIGGIVAFWIMTLVTIVTFVKLHVHSKKELILTASDAKIREGVMLNEDD